MEITGDYDDWEITDPDYDEIYSINGEEVSEEDFYEAMAEVIEREREEDALDDAAQMDEDALRDEYYQDLDQ